MNETPRDEGSPAAIRIQGTHSSGELRIPEEQILGNRIRARARSAWPQFDLDLEPFVQRVLSLVDKNAPASEALNKLALQDLYLAYACGDGVDAALKAFTQECEGELRMVAQKLRISDGDLDDVRQIVWDKLFLEGPDRSKKILEYRGTGRLRHWFRVLAARTMLDELRKARRSDKLQLLASDSALWNAAPVVDPELANMRRTYRKSFRAAFESATNSLEPEERNILKCHYLMGMSTEQLAQAFGIHKATAARQVTRARDRLLFSTRDRLKAQLGADSGDLDSVMRLFNEEMSVSLSRLLK